MTQKKEKKLTFNEFCETILDKMYEPRISQEDQCAGYHLLRKMVKEKITPASKEEFDRWKNNPTIEEILSAPNIKYLNFLHVKLRPFIIEHWDKIKKLKL